MKAGGLQCITTVDGYALPLDIIRGLPYLSMQPYTDDEWNTLPHVVFTSDATWDPSAMDNVISDDPNWCDSVSDLQASGNIHRQFTMDGHYRFRHPTQDELVQANTIQANLHSLSRVNDQHFPSPEIQVADPGQDQPLLLVHERDSKPQPPDLEAVRPYFLNSSKEVLQKTYDATTQFYRGTNVSGRKIRNTYKSPFPALNVTRRNEPVATNKVDSDTPAIDSGATSAQIFIGRHTSVGDAYAMKSDREFVNTLEDNIRKRGAMDLLISDRAQVEISKKVMDILRALVIDSWQSEPNYQHQNFAERRYRDIKAMVNWVLNYTGAPAYCWFLALCYVLYILNRLALRSLGWRTPLEALTGETPDISLITSFHFWERVYFPRYEGPYPSESTEISGRFVGFSQHVGHAGTFLVLTDDTQKVLHRSRVRSGEALKDRNLRLEPPSDGENPKSVESSTPPKVLYSKGEDDENFVMPTIDPDEIAGRTFLLPPEEDGSRFRAKIIERIDDNMSNLNKTDFKTDKTLWKFRCKSTHDNF